MTHTEDTFNKNKVSYKMYTTEQITVLFILLSFWNILCSINLYEVRSYNSYCKIIIFNIPPINSTALPFLCTSTIMLEPLVINFISVWIFQVSK